MMPDLKMLVPRAVTALLFAATLAACDSSNDPLGPDLDDQGSTLPTVVLGKVSIPTQGAFGGATLASSEGLSGVFVTVEGAQVTDTTDSMGSFRLETVTSDGKMVLRFRRGGLDAKLELEGVSPGTLIRVEVTLSNDSVSLTDSSQGSHHEFEGTANFNSISGDAPERTLRVEVADTSGTILVSIEEGSTSFDADGDLVTFEALLGALTAGKAIELEGDGTRESDGSVTAAQIKAETDDDNDDDDDGEDNDEDDFDGQATFMSVAGDAPSRTLRVAIADSSGTIEVDILEGTTTFDNEGDILSFADALAALQAGTAIEMDGEGTRQADGSITAATVKVEIDD